MPPTSMVSRAGQAVKRALQHADGWVNALTGLGYLGRDKSLGAKFVADLLTDEEAEEIYRGDDMAATIVDRTPDEMLRQGYAVKIGVTEQSDDERAAIERAIKSKFDDLKAVKKINKALKYERAYGGGAILIGADDGRTDIPSLRLPLQTATLKSVNWLNELRKRELVPVEWYSDPTAKNYGQPSIYRIQPDAVSGTGGAAANFNQVEIHESRFILFKGIEVSRQQILNNNGWGDSVLVRCNRIISQFNQSWSGAAILLADFAQAVIKIKGLAELLAANDCDAVQNRAAGVDVARSIARAIIIDSEEEYERKATPINGMPEMLQQFALRLAAAARMPVALLMRQAPAGLNATGDSDIRFYYDDVAAEREDKVRPAFESLIKMLLLAKEGPTLGIEPATWEVVFPSLWQPTEVQQSEIRLKTAQADDIWLGHDVFSSDECAQSHFGGPVFTPNIMIDMKTRRLLQGLSVPSGPVTGSGDVPRVLPLTPTDLATILSVNQVLSHPTLGYGPKRLPSGALDPDGELTVAEYQAKHGAAIAQAAAVTNAQTAPAKPAQPPIATPKTDARTRRMDACIGVLASAIGYPYMFPAKAA